MNVQSSSAPAAASIDELVATPPHPLPFAPQLAIRAFVLQRAAGHLAIYSAPGLDTLGDVDRHYLGHHHEAMFPSPTGPLFVHEDDRAAVGEALPVRATFSRRHRLADDFEVIPIPGHTPGATAFLWDAGEHRLLFTGDSIYLRDGEWVAAVLDSSNRGTYLESLELVRDLEFDVLVPWAASADGPPLAMTGEADRRRRIGAIIDRVSAGADA